MKKVFKLAALMLTIIMLLEVLPVQAINDVIEGTGEAVYETSYFDEDLYQAKEPSESIDSETEYNYPDDTADPYGFETEEIPEIDSYIDETEEGAETDREEPEMPDNETHKKNPEEKGGEEEIDLSECPEEPEAYVLGEVTGDRRPDGKVFRMSDGTVAAVSYPINVHFMDNEGNLIQIDNSPEETEEDGKELIDATKENVFEMRFAKKSEDEKIFSLDVENERISVGIKGAAESKIMNVSEKCDAGKYDVPNIAGVYLYEDILRNTDIKYTVVSTIVKENIILKDRTDFENITYIYRSDDEIEFVQKNETTVDIMKDDTVILSVSAPVMWDSTGEFCHDLALTLKGKNEEGYEIELSWNAEWANDEERVYPVTIDPITITKVDYFNSMSIIDDAYGFESDPTAANGNFEVIRVGHTQTFGKLRSVVKVDINDLIPKNANVVYAGLSLITFVYESGLVNNFSDNTYVNAYKVTSNWSEYSFCWNTFWSTNNSNGFDDQIISYAQITSHNLYTWDITEAANEWANQPSANYGIMLAYNDESALGEVFFAASDWIYAEQYAGTYSRPNLVIRYLDTNGVEDYFSAHSLDAGRAGTAYINDMTGNLTVINNILSLGHGLAPINLALVYNSNDSSESQTWPLGKGWKFNYCQTIQLTPLSVDGKRYFMYTDGDGTEHYYLENSAGGYNSTDEVDPKNKLTYNSSNYEFKLYSDNSGTKAFFKKSGSIWYLDRIEDAYGNKVTVTYSSSSHDMITKLESTDGYTVNLTYNTYSFLTSVTYTDVTTKTISFGYGGGDALSSVTYEDGKHADYTYVIGTYRLSSMSDIDGYKFEFTYNEGTGIVPLRVCGVSEKAADNTEGQHMTMSYGVKSMTLTDETNSRTYLYSFSSLGTLMSIVDITSNDKSSYSVYYEYNNKSADQLNKGNLTFASQTQKSTVNLLYNHGFENPSGVNTHFAIWGNNGNSTSSQTITSEKKHSGTYSDKVTKDTSCTRSVLYYTAYIYSGKEYTFSAYVNTVGLPQNGEGGASLLIYENNYSAESEVLGGNGNDEWRRISITFTAPNDTLCSFCLTLTGSAGYAYFDDVQLEEGGLSEYNLLENAGFDYSSFGWVYRYSPNAVHSAAGGSPGGCAKLSGGPSASPDIYQTLNISGNEGDVYVASAMAQASFAPTFHGNYAMLVRFYNGDTKINDAWIHFNPDTNAWHKAAGQAIADGNYTKITVYLIYYKGTNSAYFDNVTLTKDYFGNTYVYDEKGNITSTKDLANGDENTFAYNGNSHLISQTNVAGSNIQYNYNSSMQHQLDSVVASGVTTFFTYDNYGNAVTSKSYNSGNTKGVWSGEAYNERGDLTASADSHGNTMSYLYKEGQVKEIRDASDAKVSYEYNNSRLPILSQFNKGDTTRNVVYGYNSNNYLTKLTSPGGTVYNFTYDSFGRKTSTKVGQTTLSTNTYNGKGELTGTSYGNGYSKTFTYDEFNRLKSESSGGAVKVKYNYDGKGRISEKNDLIANRTTKNEYDLLDRIALVNTIDNSTNSIVQSSKVNYDNKNRVSGINYSYLGTTKSTGYVYGSGTTQDPSVIYGVKTGGTDVLSYTYDDLYRRTERKLNGASNFKNEYTYAAGKYINDWRFYSTQWDERCVSGDFNGDGYTDLAMMYGYSETFSRIFVWLSDGNGGYRNQIIAFESTNYNSEKIKGTITAGDYDGDGKDEIAAFYDLGSASFELHVFNQTSATSTNIAFAKEVWYTASGTFDVSKIKNRVTSGDYDGDGCDEIAAIYYYQSAAMNIFVFNPQQNGGIWSMSGGPWYSAASGTFDSSMVTGRVVSGDFDGDSKDEIAAMYDTGSYSMVLYVFNKNGSSNTLTRETWLAAATGVFGAGNVTGTMIAGNFTGDSKDDLAMIYHYPSCAKILVCKSLGTSFDHWYQ
ncbi:MAG: DNRLRE domain-containing protein, partial [Clostridia bacterium]|nr:DNRLRE domain-containing protein [Clostridia bacterium]